MLRFAPVAVLAVLVPALANAETAAPLPGFATATASWSCTPVAGVAIRAQHNCMYGIPVRAGDKLLLPRACRLQVGGKTVDRHTVEIRAGATGQAFGQMSLPARDASPDSRPDFAGAILPSTPLLYAWSGGLAAIDPATRTIEPAFEPEGSLLAAAVRGDHVVLIEGEPGKNAWQVSVLDLEAGTVLGEAAVVAGFPRWVQWTAGKEALDVFTAAATGNVRLRIQVPVTAKASPSLGIQRIQQPDPILAGRPCEIVPAADAAVVERPTAAAFSDNGVHVLLANGPPTVDKGFAIYAAATPAEKCLAVAGIDAGGHAFAWTLVDPAKGPVLRPVACKRNKL